MIIDLERFIIEERPYWEELEKLLDRVSKDVDFVMNLESARRLHYLYERTATDLSKLATFASEPELRRYLEALISRAYGEIHEVRDRANRIAPLHWFFKTFPQTFRRNIWAFGLAVAITIVGTAFGGAAVVLDSEAKEILLPFPHLSIDPRERVKQEEKPHKWDRQEGTKAQGWGFYFTHNTEVSIGTVALGVTWGIGTIIMLFTNGVMLGAVAFDYFNHGEAIFLIAWLLPHGAFEIPAILLAGQAGLVLGRALIGWGTRIPLKGRLRAVGPDIVTLTFGVALMLLWAGFIESFVSQYHQPVLPYWLKILFGVVELVLLTSFFVFGGRGARGVSGLSKKRASARTL